VDFLSVAVTKVSFVNLRKSELFPTPYSPHSITFCSGILIVAIVDSTAKTTQPPAPKVTQQNNKSHSSETVFGSTPHRSEPGVTANQIVFRRTSMKIRRVPERGKKSEADESQL
jgi:hypothetical protein